MKNISKIYLTWIYLAYDMIFICFFFFPPHCTHGDRKFKKENFLIMALLLNIDSSEPQTEVLTVHILFPGYELYGSQIHLKFAFGIMFYVFYIRLKELLTIGCQRWWQGLYSSTLISFYALITPSNLGIFK